MCHVMINSIHNCLTLAPSFKSKYKQQPQEKLNQSQLTCNVKLYKPVNVTAIVSKDDIQVNIGGPVVL